MDVFRGAKVENKYRIRYVRGALFDLYVIDIEWQI